MSLLAVTSKYLTLFLSAALGSVTLYSRLVPSIGCCVTPFTMEGAFTPAASNRVGMTSVTWANWDRISPPCAMRLGQDSTMPLRTPPRWDETCFIQRRGVFLSHAHAREYFGVELGPPTSSRQVGRD